MFTINKLAVEADVDDNLPELDARPAASSTNIPEAAATDSALQAWAQPKSRSLGPAFGGQGLEKSEAGPKAWAQSRLTASSRPRLRLIVQNGKSRKKETQQQQNSIMITKKHALLKTTNYPNKMLSLSSPSSSSSLQELLLSISQANVASDSQRAMLENVKKSSIWKVRWQREKKITKIRTTYYATMSLSSLNLLWPSVYL